MKYLFIIFGLILLSTFVYWQFTQPDVSPVAPSYTRDENADSEMATSASETETAERAEVIAENLTIPWEILFLPDGELLVTERVGRVVLLKEGVTIPVPGVRHVGEGGLLGAALHPNFEENNYIYLYQTTETQNGLINRVNRYLFIDNELQFDSTVVDNLPGAPYHDGGRIAFGPDGYLYVTLGDAGDADAAQDPENLAGSILRYTDTGAVPEDNPLGNPIYSYGHRNPQGLAWDEMGNLWSTEHGRSGVRSGFDEINRITPGANYSWPDAEGDSVTAGTEGPVRHSGADTTWAPGGLAYLDGYLYIPGLRGETLYRAKLNGTEIVSWDEFFVGEYGRLRTVVVGPDNLLYLTTSNRDGRGNPVETDDRIIRVNPSLLDA